MSWVFWDLSHPGFLLDSARACTVWQAPATAVFSAIIKPVARVFWDCQTAESAWKGSFPQRAPAMAYPCMGSTSSYAGPGPGAGGFGVYGLSAKGHGLVGATASAGAAAVVGATNGVAGAYAAAFYGPVIVGGAFTVFGAKSAAVAHPDGSHRRLYCVESPESWFEDFGKGQLECGRAEVTIDPDFAAVVLLDDFHVFLTQDRRDGRVVGDGADVEGIPCRGEGSDEHHALLVAHRGQAQGHRGTAL